MILFVWTISALVSLCPLIGWKDPDWHQRIEEYQCLISQDVGYQVTTNLSFSQTTPLSLLSREQQFYVMMLTHRLLVVAGDTNKLLFVP